MLPLFVIIWFKQFPLPIKQITFPQTIIVSLKMTQMLFIELLKKVKMKVKCYLKWLSCAVKHDTVQVMLRN